MLDGGLIHPQCGMRRHTLPKAIQMLWEERIQNAIVGRRELTLEELCAEFNPPAGTDPEVVRRALEVFEEEYEIPMGALRASDPLALFIDPPRTRNPISSLFNQVAVGDRASELSFQLKKQRKRGSP